MLIEQSAYTNRWRRVSPAAKGCFSLCGMVAAFAAGSPRTALLVAIILASATICGAGIPPLRYLRVAAPALLFLSVSALSLLVSLDVEPFDTGDDVSPGCERSFPVSPRSAAVHWPA